MDSFGWRPSTTTKKRCCRFQPTSERGWRGWFGRAEVRQLAVLDQDPPGAEGRLHATADPVRSGSPVAACRRAGLAGSVAAISFGPIDKIMRSGARGVLPPSRTSRDPRGIGLARPAAAARLSGDAAPARISRPPSVRVPGGGCGVSPGRKAQGRRVEHGGVVGAGLVQSHRRLVRLVRPDDAELRRHRADPQLSVGRRPRRNCRPVG